MRAIRIFARERSGAAAIEFALVSSIFIVTLLFIMVVAVMQYFDQALDYATMKAARQIMTGSVQKAGVGQTSFRTQVFCPYLPAALSCGSVIINLQTITEGTQPNGYYTLVNPSATALLLPTLTVDSNSFSTGVAGSYEYLQVVYPITSIPSVFARILGGGATYNGSPAYLLVSTAAFKNELY